MNIVWFPEGTIENKLIFIHGSFGEVDVSDAMRSLTSVCQAGTCKDPTAHRLVRVIFKVYILYIWRYIY